jgi:hypothetical protein
MPDDNSEEKIYIGNDGELSEDFDTDDIEPETIEDMLSSPREYEQEKSKSIRNRLLNKNLIALLFFTFVAGILFSQWLSSSESDVPIPTPTTEPTVIPTIVPTATPIGIESNADWEPVIREFNGVEMVLVPAGCFMMGSTAEEILELSNKYDSKTLYQKQGPQTEIC